MRLRTVFLLFITGHFYCACSPEKEQQSSPSAVETEAFVTQFQYAKNLTLDHKNGTVLATVKEPFKGAVSSLKYLFVPKGVNPPDVTADVTVIRTPIERLVCTSTTYLPFLETLDENEKLVGFPSTKYISSPNLIERVNSGEIIDLGKDSNINLELLLTLEPEAVLTYSVVGLSSNDDKIMKSGIPVIVGAGYLEEEPLGRAEWVKFVGLFFNKEKEADSIFNEIKKSYNEVLSAVESVEKQPTVFTSTVYKDVWYMPGGNSWAGKYFNAARADYLWKDSPESGSMELSFESVYDQAYQADYWIGTDSYSSLESLIKADARYQNFEAFQKGKIYSYNKRINEAGANDYFESGTSRPDLVLKDIVKILHPELLPDHELYFYEKLH